MAAYTIAATDVARHSIEVAAGVEDVVAITGDSTGITVLVWSGTEPVYFSINGPAAVVGGANCYAAPVGYGTPVGSLGYTDVESVRLVCAADAVVSVERTR